MQLKTIMLRYDGELKREQNCIYMLASWMVWETQRQLYNNVMMGLRYIYLSFIVNTNSNHF